MVTRVLIADDSALIRRQVRMLLERDPEVEVCAEAENGFEAVQQVEYYHPDLVVLDLLMPRMNGLEATRRIKKLAPTLPVLLFTLYDSPQLEAESKRAGADAVVPKTTGGTQLPRVIHSLLG